MSNKNSQQQPQIQSQLPQPQKNPQQQLISQQQIFSQNNQNKKETQMNTDQKIVNGKIKAQAGINQSQNTIMKSISNNNNSIDKQMTFQNQITPTKVNEKLSTKLYDKKMPAGDSFSANESNYVAEGSIHLTPRENQNLNELIGQRRESALIGQRQSNSKAHRDSNQNTNQILPHYLLPSFNNDTHDYNQRALHSYTNENDPAIFHQIDNMKNYLNKPKVTLITMSNSYRIDLFKFTQLHKQLEDLQEQNITLTSRQQQLVSREKHIYNILSQRRMEYLEYNDFLVPYLYIFNKLIKQEVLDTKAKMDNETYRPVLLRTRQEQERYFLLRYGEDDRYNADVMSPPVKQKLFDEGSLNLMIFANLTQMQPLDAGVNKQVLMSRSNPLTQQTFNIKLKKDIINRFTILTDLKIYIFFDTNSILPESIFRLPIKFTINQKRSEFQFVLKSEDDSQALEIMSESNPKSPEWFQEMYRFITLKQFLFICGRSCSTPEKTIYQFLQGKQQQEILNIHMDLQEGDLLAKDTFLEPLNQLLKEVIIDFHANLFYQIRLRLQIKIIDFTGQRLPVFLLIIFFDEIDSKLSKCRLNELILDGNSFDLNLCLKLNQYLVSPNSINLEVLSLNHTPIRDEGMFSFSQALFQRHNFMRNQKFQDWILKSQSDEIPTKKVAFADNQVEPANQQAKRDIYYHNYQLPLLTLNLRNVQMSDNGVFSLCQALENINQVNLKNNGQESDYTQKLALDISENDITENALRQMGGLFTKFNGVRYLNIAKSYRLNACYNEYFFDCLCVLQQNYSLEVLDMSHIYLNKKTLDGVIKLLSINCTIRTINIQINEELDEYISNYPDRSLLRLLQIDVHHKSRDFKHYRNTKMKNK